MNELLKKYAEIIANNTSSSIDYTSSKESIEDKINNINYNIIQKEEAQKLRLRDKLTKTVTAFIWVQLLFFNFIVLVIILSVTVKLKFFNVINGNLATLLFDFLKYYISATIVELLGMLVFILHYVFSKYSIRDKVKKYKEQET